MVRCDPRSVISALRVLSKKWAGVEYLLAASTICFVSTEESSLPVTFFIAAIAALMLMGLNSKVNPSLVGNKHRDNSNAATRTAVRSAGSATHSINSGLLLSSGADMILAAIWMAAAAAVS